MCIRDSAWTVTVTCDVTADGPLVGTETTLDAAIAARSDWTQAVSYTHLDVYKRQSQSTPGMLSYS